MQEEQKTIHRAVWPELPDPDRWLPHLSPAIEANWYTNFGPVSRRFETAIRGQFGHDHSCCIATSSATAGLAACLIARSVKGVVFCPAFTFPATASAILMAGCTPVLVDVESQTMAVSPEQLDRAFHHTQAKAALVVAPYGFNTDFSEHAEICRKHGACLVIDNAAGLGVARHGLEHHDHVDEVFSLHATKPFNIGEGGMIFSNKAHDLALRSALNFGLNSHGMTGAETRPFWGINGKLSELHAAVGMAVLDEIEDRISARKKMAGRWIAVLSRYKQITINQDVEAGPWQVFPVLMPNEKSAETFVANAMQHGVELRRYYRPSLGHCQGLKSLHPCKIANDLSARCVTLPVRSKLEPEIQEELIGSTCAALEETLSD